MTNDEDQYVKALRGASKRHGGTEFATEDMFALPPSVKAYYDALDRVGAEACAGAEWWQAVKQDNEYETEGDTHREQMPMRKSSLLLSYCDTLHIRLRHGATG